MSRAIQYTIGETSIPSGFLLAAEYYKSADVSEVIQKIFSDEWLMAAPITEQPDCVYPVCEGWFYIQSVSPQNSIKCDYIYEVSKEKDGAMICYI